MGLEFLGRRRVSKEKECGTKQSEPVLKEEDEEFLHRIAFEGRPPPLPQRPLFMPSDGRDSNNTDLEDKATMLSAAEVPLPISPGESGRKYGVSMGKRKEIKNYFSSLPSFSRRLSLKGNGRQKAATDSLVAGGTVLPESSIVKCDDKYAAENQNDLTAVLDQLNLAAVNNRVFSFSKESRDLFEQFTQILKDIVNGVPTAYDDLEKLLTNSESQLQDMFSHLPPVLQSLVKSLPAKITAGLGSELLAAASENPNINDDSPGTSNRTEPETKDKKKKRSRVPSLKTMITQQGAVASMLRGILEFLKLRFPTVLAGTNILMSLAIFLLLFVFWYCHKRGRETRLTREAAQKPASSDIELTDVEDSIIIETKDEVRVDEQYSKPDSKTSRNLFLSDEQHTANKANFDGRIADMPSVADLPLPATVQVPKTNE